MSLINIIVDTENKTINMNVDGESVDGEIRNVYVCRCEYQDEYKIDFSASVEHEKVGKVNKITNYSVYASETKDVLGKNKDIFLHENSSTDWVKFLK